MLRQHFLLGVRRRPVPSSARVAIPRPPAVRERGERPDVRERALDASPSGARPGIAEDFPEPGANLHLRGPAGEAEVLGVAQVVLPERVNRGLAAPVRGGGAKTTSSNCRRRGWSSHHEPTGLWALPSCTVCACLATNSGRGHSARSRPPRSSPPTIFFEPLPTSGTK